jgi:HPt (histidine-containing phosphotransfer) domain-containing protein
VRQAGADEFVGKPFDAANLLQVVDRLARRSAKGIRQLPNRTGAAPITLGVLPLLDANRLLDVESIARDDTFLSRLVRGFQSDVITMLQKLDGAVAEGRVEAMTDVTHGIKGAALGIGAQQLAARCAEVEQAADAGQTDRLRGLVAELRRCFESTSDQLNAYTASKTRATR